MHESKHVTVALKPVFVPCKVDDAKFKSSCKIRACVSRRLRIVPFLKTTFLVRCFHRQLEGIAISRNGLSSPKIHVIHDKNQTPRVTNKCNNTSENETRCQN